MKIPISQLPAITSAEHFFNADSVVWIEMVDLTEADPVLLVRLIMLDLVIQADNGWFYINFLVGRPEVISKQIKDGFELPILGKVESVFDTYDEIVKNGILKEKIFDFSLYFSNPENQITLDQNFIIQKFFIKEKLFSPNQN